MLPISFVSSNSTKIIFLMALLVFSFPLVSHAMDFTGMQAPPAKDSTKVKSFAQAIPMAYKAKVGNNCYTVESDIGAVDADTGNLDSVYSDNCKTGYVAMANGSSLQVIDTITPWGKLGSAGIKTLASKRNTTCCKIIYVWEPA